MGKRAHFYEKRGGVGVLVTHVRRNSHHCQQEVWHVGGGALGPLEEAFRHSAGK